MRTISLLERLKLKITERSPWRSGTMYVVIRPTWSKVKKGREGRGEIGGADYGKDESTEGG